MSSAAATGECEVTRQKKKKSKLKHVQVGVAPSQSPHASKLLPAVPSLQTPALSPTPGTPILEEAVMRKKKIRKEHKGSALLLPQNPDLEEVVMAMTRKKQKPKERKRVEISLSYSSTSAAETPILEQEEKVGKKRNRRMEQEPSGDSALPLHPADASRSLLAAPFLQFPAPEILTLQQAATMMRERKVRKEQKVDALKKKKKALMTMMKKKECKPVEQILLSPCTFVAPENPIKEQEVKLIKKQKQRRGQKPSCKSQEPSGNSPLPLHHGHACNSLLAAPLFQSPAPEILTLERAAVMRRKRKMLKEQKLDALPSAQNPTLEEQEEAMMAMKKKRKHVEQEFSSPSTHVAAETPIQEQEVKVIKKQKQRRGQQPSGNPPLSLHPGHAPREVRLTKEQEQQRGLEPSGKSQEPSSNLPLTLHHGHSSMPLLAAPSLPSPAPEILTLQQAATMMRERKALKEQKVDALPFTPNPVPTSEEEQGQEAMTMMKKKECKPVEQILLSPCTFVAPENPIKEQEVKLIKKQKQRRGQKPSCKSQEPSGNSSLPLHPGHACNSSLAAPLFQSPAPEILTLEHAAVMMRKRKMLKEQRLDALPFAQNPSLEEKEEAMMAMKKKRKHVEQQLSSPSTHVAAETPIQEQEVKVIKKQKQRRGQQPSVNSPLSLHPGHAPREVRLTKEQEQQRGLEPSGKSQEPSSNLPLTLQHGHSSMPLLAAPSLPSPAPEILTLQQAATMMRERKVRKEQKVDALPFTPNPVPTSEEEQGQEALMTMMKKKECKPVEQILLSPCTFVAPENPIKEQEVKLIKKQKQRRGQKPSCKSQEPSGNSPLPLHPGHACNSSLAAPLFQSPAPEILTLEQAALMMRKRKMLKEQKLDALPFAQNPTLEEQEEEAMMAMKKKRKHVEQQLSSPSTHVAAETPIQEQEMKVIKKQKQRRGQKPSGNSPLSLHPSHAPREVRLTKEQEQQRGLEPSGKSQEPSSNLPLTLHLGHSSMPLLAAPSLQSPSPEILTLGEAAAMMRKRKMRKEKKVPTLSFPQNPTLEEEQGKEDMKARMKERLEQILSSPSTSGAAEIPIQEQQVTKKQNQRRGQESSGKSPLPLDPGQARCVQAERAKAPPEQEGENDGCKGITKSNGKKPSIRALSNRELIQEARKQQRPLPEEFVPFNDFVASCTDQNPDHSPPYSAFFEQFRYNPVCEDRKPPLPRTPDRLAKLPPRGYSSFGSSQIAANETSMASRSNTTLASKTKQQDAGSGSQEKVNVKVVENPENITREKKQRKPFGKSRLLFYPSQTCCVQLQGTKAQPEQDLNTDVPKVNNIEKSNSKKACARAPIKRKLFKEMAKELMVTEGLWAPKDFVPNCTEQSTNYSLPSGASFERFCYRSARQDLNPQLPRSTDRLSKLPPRHYPSFESSELTASETAKAFKANSSVVTKSKKKDSGSVSLGSQKKLNVKEKTTPEKTPRTRKPPPVFTTAEKRSDKYRRVPLDQLVPPPRSPYNLLQENHASDPWKVIIICMFLNLTQGIQVKRILEGFFDRYPDARSALNADPDKMAEYLAPLGLQHVKTRNIQKFSKQYLEEEWTHITELCGVGKYAADAYAIFCAGRATEVVPQDHMLLHYWNYVCFELPMTQAKFELVEVRPVNGVPTKGSPCMHTNFVARSCEQALRGLLFFAELYICGKRRSPSGYSVIYCEPLAGSSDMDRPRGDSLMTEENIDLTYCFACDHNILHPEDTKYVGGYCNIPGIYKGCTML